MIEKTMETGSDEPTPPPVVELQQMTLGLLLIWDVLGDHYSLRSLVEQGALSDWARKHRINRAQAIEALGLVKQKFLSEPWVSYIQCRNFIEEGWHWHSAQLFNPAGNADVLKMIHEILDYHPFPEP